VRRHVAELDNLALDATDKHLFFQGNAERLFFRSESIGVFRPANIDTNGLSHRSIVADFFSQIIPLKATMFRSVPTMVERKRRSDAA
jgi:hypothetical protein